jgi:hypothetical protein
MFIIVIVKILFLNTEFINKNVLLNKYSSLKMIK